MERWVVKIFALVGTFILPLISTLLPYRVSALINARGDSGKRILSYLMCLGGGIFFGTYLLHMGPEVKILLDESLLIPNKIDYPVAELITGIGFFFVLFAEKIVLRCNKRRLKRKKASLCHNESEILRETTSPQLTVVTCVNPEEACQPCILGLPCSGNDKEDLVMHSVDVETGVVKLTSCTDIEDVLDHTGKSCDPKSCPFSGSGDCCSDDKSKKPDLKQREKQILLNSKIAEAEKTQAGGDGMKRPSQLSIDPQKKTFGSVASSLHSHGGGHNHHHNTRSIVLILALSLHRIFEGMSVGLQMTSQDVIHLFVAVMCHEMVIGFSLGLQFVKSNFPLKRLVITTLLCSIIMPLGVAVGTIMTETGHQSRELDISNGILQAFAMGTFIYVTFFEILQEEVDPDDTSVAKIFFIALGFCLMALLTLIPEEQKLLVVHPLASTVSPLVANGTSTFASNDYVKEIHDLQ